MNSDGKTLYMIGNAHLDPVWLWQWQEGFQEAKATFRSALDRLAESDDFLFTSSSAALYEWIEANDPEMFQEIARRIAEGRWEIAGGWWIQPDCNIPSGESLVRQGLYGQRFFKSRFGVTATVGYNVDSFGHAGSLPQILCRSGLTSYVFTRPHPHEQRLPSRLFWWESDDGSRVLTFRIPYEYNSGPGDIRHHVERCAAEISGPVQALMCFYGVGNHGGGPTRENIEAIRQMQSDPSLPALVFSTPSRYFAEVRNTPLLPVFHDELQHHASGCYSAHSGVKRANRAAETMLLTAEKMSSLAMLATGLPYPRDLERAWKDVLFNQFHDILAGTSIEPAYDDAAALYGEAMAIGGRALNNAVQSISWRVAVPEEEGSRSIVVFNPHAWPVRAPVELEWTRIYPDSALLDASGERVPVQPVRSEATVASGSRTRICFLADVPSFGYTTYKLFRGPELPELPEMPHMDANDVSIDTARFTLQIDPDSGSVTSLRDKRLDFEWLREPAAQGTVLADFSDTWSHGVLTFDDVIGEFRASSVRLVDRGPVKATIRVESEYGSSRLTQDFTLYRDLDVIDVGVTVDWHERFAMLKLAFPLNLFFTTPTYEIPYGVIHRPANGEEEPGQTWVDLTGVARGDGRLLGMSICNDGKYSFAMTEKQINLTVLRSPIYAHHTPYEPQVDGDYRFIDQGEQRFRYRLVPHEGSWEGAETARRAAELNMSLISIAQSAHPGPLPQTDSYLGIGAPNIAVTVVKRAEEGDALILRCHETSGVATQAAIWLPHTERRIEASFAPTEIKTFRVPLDPERDVTETDLMEWEHGSGGA